MSQSPATLRGAAIRAATAVLSLTAFASADDGHAAPDVTGLHLGSPFALRAVPLGIPLQTDAG